jgi:hypothetical protein
MKAGVLIFLAFLLGCACGAAGLIWWQRQAGPTPAAPAASPAPAAAEAVMAATPPAGPAQPPADAAPPTPATAEPAILLLMEKLTEAERRLDDLTMRLEVRTGQLRPFRASSDRSPLAPFGPAAGGFPPPAETTPRSGDELPEW